LRGLRSIRPTKSLSAQKSLSIRRQRFWLDKRCEMTTSA
jgi:hypothetical protein